MAALQTSSGRVGKLLLETKDINVKISELASAVETMSLSQNRHKAGEIAIS